MKGCPTSYEGFINEEEITINVNLNRDFNQILCNSNE